MNREFTKPSGKTNPLKNKYALIALSIFVSSLLIVYWVAIWPSTVADDCHEEAIAAMGLGSGQKFYATEKTSLQYMTYFEMCKNKSGL